jgi:hypothetical protein
MVLYGSDDSDHIIVTRLGQAGFKHVTGGVKVTVSNENFWPFSQCFGSALFSMRIRILVRLCRHKKLDFDMKNYIILVLCQQIYLRRYKSPFGSLEIMFIC